MRFTRATSAAQDSGDPVVARPRRRLLRGLSATAAVAAGSVLIAACGSGSSNNGGGGNSSSGTPSTVSGLKQTGVGLNQPTAPSGAKVSDATVTWAESPAAQATNIFPMYSASFCTTSNIDDLQDLLYRPVYWYGNNYSPTVDYSYSPGNAPTFSNGGKTVTITMKDWKWSDGESVDAEDVVFWMNMLKAAVNVNPENWCSTVPKRFPYNVTSYKAVNKSTFQLTFNAAYNPTWVIYNELSQLTPIPLSWAKTSSSAATPTTAPTNAKMLVNLYNTLQTDGSKSSTWGSSPIWGVVDGPWKVQSATSNGLDTFVPNSSYTGPDKPQYAKFVEVPFLTDTASFNETKSGGPSALTISSLPAQDVPQSSAVAAEGYTVNKASNYSVNYFPLNEHNPVYGGLFSQTYFRQAFQSLIDQNGWITSILHGTAVNTPGSIPSAPPSSLLPGVTSGSNPYPFSIAKAKSLLTANGWKVAVGDTTCIKPGAAAGDCGPGISKGEKISFNLDYASGIEALQSEMLDLQSNAKQVGINLDLTTHPFQSVVASGQACAKGAADCKWAAENWGAGWVYAPDFYPTGELLFATGAASDSSSYSNPEMDKLINNTITASASQENAAMKAFYQYTETSLPFVWGPTSIGTFGASAGTLVSDKLGGYTANAFASLTPEQWYLTK